MIDFKWKKKYPMIELKNFKKDENIIGYKRYFYYFKEGAVNEKGVSMKQFKKLNFKSYFKESSIPRSKNEYHLESNENYFVFTININSQIVIIHRKNVKNEHLKKFSKKEKKFNKKDKNKNSTEDENQKFNYQEIFDESKNLFNEETDKILKRLKKTDKSFYVKYKMYKNQIISSILILKKIKRILLQDEKIFFVCSDRIVIYTPFRTGIIRVNMIDVCLKHYLYILTANSILVYGEKLINKIDINLKCDKLHVINESLFFLASKNVFYKIENEKVVYVFNVVRPPGQILSDDKFIYIRFKRFVLGRFHIYDHSIELLSHRMKDGDIYLSNDYLFYCPNANGILIVNKLDFSEVKTVLLDTIIKKICCDGENIHYLTGKGIFSEKLPKLTQKADYLYELKKLFNKDCEKMDSGIREADSNSLKQQNNESDNNYIYLNQNLIQTRTDESNGIIEESKKDEILSKVNASETIKAKYKFKEKEDVPLNNNNTSNNEFTQDLTSERLINNKKVHISGNIFNILMQINNDSTDKFKRELQDLFHGEETNCVENVNEQKHLENRKEFFRKLSNFEFESEEESFETIVYSEESENEQLQFLIKKIEIDDENYLKNKEKLKNDDEILNINKISNKIEKLRSSGITNTLLDSFKCKFIKDDAIEKHLISCVCHYSNLYLKNPFVSASFIDWFEKINEEKEKKQFIEGDYSVYEYIEDVVKNFHSKDDTNDNNKKIKTENKPKKNNRKGGF